MRLEAIQRLLGDAFRGATPLTERDDLRAAIEAIVSGNDRLTPSEQADIYREQFWLRHKGALYEDYPALAWYLGQEAFEAFARAYLDACPPDSFTLRDLGNRIADFADGYAGFSPDEAGPARDLARFERAFVDVFDGPDAEPVTLEAVQALPAEAWPAARLTLQPGLTVVSLAHPVHPIRTAVKQGQTPSRAIAPAPTEVALWRGADLKVHYKSIDAAEARIVAALRDGLPLGDAIAGAAAALDEAAQQALAGKLAGWFKAWAMRGWIVGVGRS